MRVALVLGLALAVAGCSSSGSSSGTTTAAPAPSPAASTTAAPTTTAGSTTTSGATTTAAASTTAVATTAPSDRCHTNQLTASLGPANPGAGNVYFPLILTNTSTSTCEVAGYPGVSLLGADGQQIGPPATRAAGTASTVRLAPGASASVALHTINQGIAPGGCLPPSAKVRVFPPNELDALVVSGQITVCADMFSVSPLVAGTNGV